jgi:hypothetical protein
VASLGTGAMRRSEPVHLLAVRAVGENRVAMNWIVSSKFLCGSPNHQCHGTLEMRSLGFCLFACFLRPGSCSVAQAGLGGSRL